MDRYGIHVILTDVLGAKVRVLFYIYSVATEQVETQSAGCVSVVNARVSAS
jgi:hypothetical protein